MNKKGKKQSDKQPLIHIPGWFWGLLLIGLFAGAGYGIYYATQLEGDIKPPPPPLFDDALTTVYDESLNDDATAPGNIVVKDYYDPDHASLTSLAWKLYKYGTGPAAERYWLIANDEAELLDSGNTDGNGEITTGINLKPRKLYTLVIGADDSTNKSQYWDFVCQGYGGNTVPSSLYCGIAYYKVMAEESECTWSWTDEQGTTITSWNYTSDTDGILKAKVKLVMDTTGHCLRKIWHRKYGTLELLLAVKVTHKNSTSSGAIDIESSYDAKDTPGTQLVFAWAIPEVIYEVDSSGNVVDSHESYRYWSVILDFNGCGFPATYVAATALQFEIAGWCLVEQSISQPIDAGLPSGDSSSWFKDTLATLTITT